MIPIKPNEKAHKDQIVWGGRMRSLLCPRVRWNHFYSIIQASFSQGRSVEPQEFGLLLPILSREQQNFALQTVPSLWYNK